MYYVFFVLGKNKQLYVVNKNKAICRTHNIGDCNFCRRKWRLQSDTTQNSGNHFL